MKEAFKDWMPITRRNRIGLGFAFAALVMFVTWNFLPYYEADHKGNEVAYVNGGPVLIHIWAEVVDPDLYQSVIRSPDIDGFLSVAACMALLLNGLIVLSLVPLWKMLHVSSYLTVPVAVLNLLGGLVVLKLLFENFFRSSNELYGRPPNQDLTLFLISLTMFAVSAAMAIFKNELALRHELEVKKMMGD